VILRRRRAILPMHGSRKEMKRGTIVAIKKQFGLE
jgi:predicted RNA binding protein YcfA (HicA-like mRNA interferase family)